MPIPILRYRSNLGHGHHEHQCLTCYQMVVTNNKQVCDDPANNWLQWRHKKKHVPNSYSCWSFCPHCGIRFLEHIDGRNKWVRFFDQLKHPVYTPLDQIRANLKTKTFQIVEKSFIDGREVNFSLTKGHIACHDYTNLDWKECFKCLKDLRRKLQDYCNLKNYDDHSGFYEVRSPKLAAVLKYRDPYEVEVKFEVVYK